MPKWKADAKRFTVGVNYSEVRGYQATIPKPVMEHLGRPARVTFTKKGKMVVLSAAEEEPVPTG